MGSRFLLITTFLLSVSVSSFAADYGSSGCDGEFSNETWDQLASQEPRIRQELETIAVSSGQVGNTKVKLTNCRVEWPVNEKKEPIPGYRTGVLHHIWYTTSANGESVRNEGGMRLVWFTKYREVQVGSDIYIESVRTLKGFTICQSPVVCATLNVLGLKEGAVTPTPVSLNNPSSTKSK